MSSVDWLSLLESKVVLLGVNARTSNSCSSRENQKNIPVAVGAMVREQSEPAHDLFDVIIMQGFS